MKNSLGMFSLKNRRILLWMFCALAVYFLVFHNLTRFPAPWFDEGSHLHVPKTLIQYGVYADISSEGFRYYGPTIGVGPTVMLPIAAAFKLFGIGLLQARLVMALYLFAAIYVFYQVSKTLTNHYIALVACTLLISSRVVFLLEYGRQLLGEVPGLFFLLMGLWLWFTKWENASWKRLTIVGLFFGLAMVTKYQYLLFIMPMLGLAWILNFLYYKTTSHGHFIIPAFAAGVLFAAWQGITIRYLGPATMLENLALLRASAEGAAFTFSLERIGNNLVDLKSRAAYILALIPALFYGTFISLPRTRESQKMGVIFLLVVLNLSWYILTSIGWIRYAFLGLALSSIFIARFFYDVTDDFRLELNLTSFPRLLQSFHDRNTALRFALIAWLVLIVLFPMAKTISEIATPGPDSAREMSDYLNANVPMNALIETWEPEMGFLTDHKYHYPPNRLLAVAIEQAYSGGEPVQNFYTFVQDEGPDYLLVGTFAKRTDMYPLNELMDEYQLVQTFGDYDLYRRMEK